MKKLFDMYLIQKNDIDMGVTCDGEALVSPTDEGVFSGDDGLSGKVLPIGMGVTYTPAPAGTTWCRRCCWRRKTAPVY